MRGRMLVLALVALAILPSAASAMVYDPLYMSGSHSSDWYYNPPEHSRFYTADDPDLFIGQDFDWSGIGHLPTSHRRWGVAISPTWFLAARHYPPVGNSVMTFYRENPDGSTTAYDRTVKGGSCQELFWDGVRSDLCLERLTEPLDPDEVKLYSILDYGSDSEYLTKTIYLYGGYLNPITLAWTRGVAAKNNIDQILTQDYTDTYGVLWHGRAMRFDYDAGANSGNEAITSFGDSGSPSFIVEDGELMLVGIHWLSDAQQYSWDSFVPAYLDQIRGIAVEEDLNGDGFVGADDLDIIRLNWGAAVTRWDLARGDANGDGLVGADDLDIIRLHWGEGTPPTPESLAGQFPGYDGSVPEPSTLAVVLGGLWTLSGLALRRRHA